MSRRMGTAKLTKDEFIGDLLRGYSVVEYRLRANFWGYRVEKGEGINGGSVMLTDDPDKVECACVIGAAALGAGMKPKDYLKRLPERSARLLSTANDLADKPYGPATWQKYVTLHFTNDMEIDINSFSKNKEAPDPVKCIRDRARAEYGFENRGISTYE